MQKLVVFDLDGTLFDTLDDLTYYVNQAIIKFGYNEIDRSVTRKHVCAKSKEFLRLCMGEEDVDNPIIDQCHAYYSEQYKNSGSPRTKYYEHVEEVVFALKNAGYKIAIYTNKTQEQTDVIIKNHAKEGTYDLVVGQKQGVVGKPDPSELFKIMDYFKVNKENTFFVGDGDTDVLAGLRAGVNLIAVTYGYRDKEDLKALGATVFADNALDVYRIITGKNFNE